MDFSVAARGFIVDENNNLLVLKREAKDVHMPGIWEPPGGRLNSGENPFEGLKREVKEETGLDVEIKDPMTIRHFTRQDGQVITMLTFLCRPLHKDVVISGEHTDFKWISLDKEDKELQEFMGMDGFYWDEVNVFKRRFKS